MLKIICSPYRINNFKNYLKYFYLYQYIILLFILFFVCVWLIFFLYEVFYILQNHVIMYYVFLIFFYTTKLFKFLTHLKWHFLFEPIFNPNPIDLTQTQLNSSDFPSLSFSIYKSTQPNCNPYLKINNNKWEVGFNLLH